MALRLRDFVAAASARSLRFADGPDEVHKRSLARRELRRYGPRPGDGGTGP